MGVGELQHLQSRTVGLESPEPLSSPGLCEATGSDETSSGSDKQEPRLLPTSGSRGLHGDHLGHACPPQPREGVREGSRDVLRSAGLTEFQEEVLLIGPEGGGDGEVARDDRGEDGESEGLREDCSLWMTIMETITLNQVYGFQNFALGKGKKKTETETFW